MIKKVILALFFISIGVLLTLYYLDAFEPSTVEKGKEAAHKTVDGVKDLAGQASDKVRDLIERD